MPHRPHLLLSAALLAAIAWAVATWPQPARFDPAFLRLSPAEVARLPFAVRWDAPLGAENGALAYNAQPFRRNRHLGDDLNGIGGLESDFGDPVYASGLGRVVYVGVPGPAWGGMVILAHRVRLPEGTRVVQTVYAHLEEMRVQHGQLIQRGQVIGTVGNAGGRYPAHLHFEVRLGPYVNPGVGYANAPLNRLSPEIFLRQHRGAEEAQLHPAPMP
jgi:hypothetical protein